MPTYKSKIGRLPASIREQLNERLADGEPGESLLEWLNALPEAQAILTDQFGGKSVSEPNLSRWRAGGYQHWLQSQDRQYLLEIMAGHTQDFEAQGGVAEIHRRISTLFMLDLARVVNNLERTLTDPDKLLPRLQEAVRMFQRLRHEDYLADKLKFDQERRDPSPAKTPPLAPPHPPLPQTPDPIPQTQDPGPQTPIPPLPVGLVLNALDDFAKPLQFNQFQPGSTKLHPIQPTKVFK